MKPESEKFLSAIQSSDAEVRFAAWTHANEIDPEVIPSLGKLLVADQPGVRKAADEALKRMVHTVGKQAAGGRRVEIVKQLAVLTGDGQAVWTRTMALRHLSLIGGDDAIPAAAKLLRNPELQEEAVFCLERIPGPTATKALISALPNVNDVFKARILAALGHRKAEEATDICAGAMASPNSDLAMAGMKALARIGKKPAGDVKPPSSESLSGWQKVEFADSALRYAAEQTARGNMEDAIKIYRDLLSRTEEHLQCAAIIGLGKTGTAEGAALIFTKLKSSNHNVRITAGKTWTSMAKV